MPHQTSKWYILPVIVCSQLVCTSLWFAGNAVITDLSEAYSLSEHALGYLTSSIQFGFICGTLLFALLTIVDRFSPALVFLCCALLGGLFNLGILLEVNTFTSLFLFRFCTGFCLAGIYPVGMKIAADYHERGLGMALGWLVGALVVGTALPHLLQVFLRDIHWQYVILSTSILSGLGGMSMWWFVPDGPFRKASQSLDLSAFFNVFRQPKFRAAAFGYFGHMWELYAFWTFVPLLLAQYASDHGGLELNIAWYAFLIIGIGGASCVAGGYLALRFGSRRIAMTALSLSGLCCLISPFSFQWPFPLFLFFLFVWGIVVIADSPQFSTLVAQNAPIAIKGTALTIVNCIGFSLTIISILLLNYLMTRIDFNSLFLLLAIGPFFGLLAMGFRAKSSS